MLFRLTRNSKGRNVMLPNSTSANQHAGKINTFVTRKINVIRQDLVVDRNYKYFI